MAMRDGAKQLAKRPKGWHVAVVVVMVLAGLIVIYVATTKARLDRRLKALRAAGYPTTIAELAEYNKLPLGAPNAAGVYRRAFAVFAPPDWANTPYFGSAQLPDRGKPLPEPMIRVISQCLEDNKQCLSLLHEAAGIRDCDYDSDRLNPGTTLPLADIRYCTHLLVLGAVYHSHSGDPNVAAKCIEDGLRLADSIQREPSTVGYVTRVACMDMTLNGLERSLSVTTFTDKQLAELDEALATTAGTLDVMQVLVLERCLTIEMCRDPSLRYGPSGGVGPWMRPSVTKMGITDTLNYMEDCMRAARLPPAERLEAFREATQKMDGLSFIHLPMRLVSLKTSHMTELAELDARACARIILARTALPVERYRLATGQLPERLGDLVPQYLTQVPVDPFDRQPIRYRRTEPGYVLYSVDMDGQDHGGQERPDDSTGGPYDWCFIVKH